MVIALAATMLHPNIGAMQFEGIALVDGGYSGAAYGLLLGTIAVGVVIGGVMAKRVQMTSMPELVALLHSFVGLAAVLVGFSSFLSHKPDTIHSIEVYIDVVIGAITFTGSVVAWAKLKGKIFGYWILANPFFFRETYAQLGILIGIISIGAVVASTTSLAAAPMGLAPFTWLVIAAIVAGILGVHLVLAIGGADMPVVVSLLNSYSGWTASAAGFMLGNDLLIITGALVGSSGAILSYIMCKAMNRSIRNVVFGGFGATPTAGSQSTQEQEGEIQEIDAEDLGAENKPPLL